MKHIIWHAASVRATRCFSWKYGCQTSFTYLESEIHMCFNAFDSSPRPCGSGRWHGRILRRVRAAQHRQMSGFLRQTSIPFMANFFYSFFRQLFRGDVTKFKLSRNSQLPDSLPDADNVHGCFGRKRWYRMIMKLERRSRIAYVRLCADMGAFATRKGRRTSSSLPFYDADRVALLLLLSCPN